MKNADKAAVEAFAEKMLGQSRVATITSATLRNQGVNVEELDARVEKYRALPASERVYEIEKNVGEPDDPTSFGLLVRRRG